MKDIHLSHPTKVVRGSIHLDGSKSISNRVLLIKALCAGDFCINGLSTSDDTTTLLNLIEQKDVLEVFDCHHAGTTYRFMTAYLATQPGCQTLTGSSRMLERPIGPLVDALRSIGAEITYLGQEGYPPLLIGELDPGESKEEVTIDASISSQYISALMMIAPVLPNGLTIHLVGDLVSESYLRLTMDVMRHFGIEVDDQLPTIKITSQSYTPKDFLVEADWSAASYYYSLVSLAQEAEITLTGLSPNSYQGDSILAEVGHHLGVQSAWQDNKLVLTKTKHCDSFELDFINCPDIAQTIAVICAGLQIPNKMSGLQTLKIKETDRISAVDQELHKLGSGFRERTLGVYCALPLDTEIKATPTFATYKDHRMAMAFAPLALLHDIQVSKPGVVSKSYPKFWEDMERMGFVVRFLEEN